MDFASQPPPTNLTELRRAAKTNNNTWSVGALFLSLTQDLPVKDLLIANMILVASAGVSNWRREIESEIEKVVVGNWLRIASPSQRFNLISPPTNAPRVLQAAAAQTSGLKKAAQVLLAAKDAVGVVLPSSLLHSMQNLAESVDQNG
jgi:hypothetical protein